MKSCLGLKFFSVLTLWSTILAATLTSQKVHACASCGSGGDDPLILYPNETYKLYLGTTRSYAFESVQPSGKVIHAGGVRLKDTNRAAIGYSLGLRSFVTATFSQITNRAGHRHLTAWGDPSLAARYTLLPFSFATPYLPQIQLLVGYKHNSARSMHLANDRYSLDIFGTGFKEYRIGTDFWYAWETMQIGAAYIFSFNEPNSFNGRNFRPGHTHRYVGTVGVIWCSFAKATAGIAGEQQGVTHAEGKQLRGSRKVSHNYFINQDIKLSSAAMLRASFSHAGSIISNRNTARFKSAGLAYIHSW